MKVFSRGKTRQRGAALLALAALVVLGATWMLVSAFSSASGRSAAQVGHNARVLAEAKAALIAWVAIHALDATEDNPGRLPCPQAWGDVGSANEGRAAGNCSAPAVGWLPWRTLGLPKLLDAAGQQLWYVISPGWHLPSGGATLTLNSNTPGQLTLDGRAAVALIIAPGPALNSAPNANQAAAGCAARSQLQALNLPSTGPNPRDFLECQNGSTADNVFTASVVDNATNRVFNDHVLAITVADILPALEAAIAKRIERDIVPQLKSVYATTDWSLNSTNPVFPYAAPFENPGTSSFQGAAGTFQGLLPFNQTQGCTADAANPRCLPTLVDWSSSTVPVAYKKSGYGYIQTQTCSWQPSTAVKDSAECEGKYHEDDTNAFTLSQKMRIEMSATLNNVAMGLRVLDTTRMVVEARDDVTLGPWQPQPVTYAATMNSNGSATITFYADLPNIDDRVWGTYAQFRVRLERSVIADHPLLSTSAATTGWFVRNEWYRLVYYASAPNHAASGPRSCNDTPPTPTCLQVANIAPANKQRSILILAGRSLTGAMRPNATLTDFLEGVNADLPADLVFEQRVVNASFNDRVVVVDANP